MKIIPYDATCWKGIEAVHDPARMQELRYAGLEAAFLPLSIAAEREDLFDYNVYVAKKDEKWYILEDNLRVPSGASYPMIARELCRRSSPETFTDLKMEDNRNYAELLRRTFDNVNVAGHTVILTPGRYNVPLSTNINTTAEEAFVQGQGVCQDYAHIFIALLHLAKIPSRYVTGLIVGEGASHAWVEILCGRKWYGIDPTNNCIVSDEHIKIGIGRDARDCMINRGIMHGGGLHTQKISVSVTESDF